MQVSGQFRTPAALPTRKEDLSGFQSQFDALEKIYVSYFCQQSNSDGYGMHTNFLQVTTNGLKHLIRPSSGS